MSEASFSSFGASQEDIIWTAAIDDRTGQFFSRFEKRIQSVTASSARMFNEVDAGGAAASASVSDVSDSLLDTVGSVFAAVSAFGLLKNAITDVAGRAVDLIKDSTTTAARVEELGVILEVVGQAAGYSLEELEAFDKGIQANGITARASRQIMLEMIQTNLDLANAIGLTRVAQDAATTALLDSSEAAMRLIHGIATLNPLTLRRMNIIIDLEEEYRRLTGTVDASARNLTVAQKQAIAMNAVLTVGTRISGAYEAAMGTAGKQVRSMRRYMEDLEAELGKITLPAYTEIVFRLKDALIAATEWLKENEEAARDFGYVLKDLVVMTTYLVDALGVLAKINPFAALVKDGPGPLKSIAIGIASIVIGFEEATERAENLWLMFKQFIGTAIAGGAIVATTFKELVGIIGDIDKAGRTAFFAGIMDVEEVAAYTAAMAAVEERIAGIGDKAREAGTAAARDWAAALGMMESFGDAAETAASKIDLITQETMEAIEIIKALNAKMTKDFAEMALRQTRQDIDEEIREIRKREDLELSHINRLEGIEYSFGQRRIKMLRDQQDKEADLLDDQVDKRLELEKDKSLKLIEIEIDYRRELEDIQRHFEEDVEEAARQNDAVAVARLIRKRARDRRDAKIERARSIEDLDRDYAQDLKDLKEFQEKRRKEIKDDMAQRMKHLQDDLDEALARADVMRERELDKLELYLDRNEIDKTRHRDWDEDDIRRRYRTQADELAEHLAQMEFIDESSLRYLLSVHGQYIQDDLKMWEEYYYQRGQYLSGGLAGPRYGQPSSDVGADLWYEEQQQTQNQGWGFARGGVGLATRRTDVTVAEDEPEMFAAIPLSAMITHNINLSGRIGVDGVSPGMEQDMGATMSALLEQFAIQLLAGRPYSWRNSV